MRLSLSTRSWTWLGAAALALTVGVMAHRSSDGTAAPSEELRDAVASPALSAAARPMPSAAAFARVARPRPPLAARLSRLADALDAKAASLRRSAR